MIHICHSAEPQPFIFTSCIVLVLEALFLEEDFLLLKHAFAFSYLMLSPCLFPFFTWDGSQWAVEMLTELKDVTQRCLWKKRKWFGVRAVDKTHVFMRKCALLLCPFLNAFVCLWGLCCFCSPHVCTSSNPFTGLIPFMYEVLQTTCQSCMSW